MIPGPRHGTIDPIYIDASFSFFEDTFAALPADLNNPQPSERVGIFQGKCFVTAIGLIPFDSSAAFECIQSFYLITDQSGAYTDAISYTAPFFLTATSQPGPITGGTSKYMAIVGQAIPTGSTVSPDGKHVYDGLKFVYKLV